MSWQYVPTSWGAGYFPTQTDYNNIAADIQTWGGNVDGGANGLVDLAFFILNPGALPGTTYTVTAASWSGGTAVFTIGSHNIKVNQLVTISGVTPSGYDVTLAAVTAIASTTFSVAIGSNPGTWTSGGSVVVSGISPAAGMIAVDQADAPQIWNGSAWIPLQGASTYSGNLTLVNGTNENIALPSAAQFIFLAIVGPTGAFSIGGFAGGYPGQRIQIFDDTSQAMTINNLDSGSSASNQIHTCTGANVTGAVVVDFTYLDSGGNVWLVTNHNP